MSIKVSVIIPTYNRPQNLQRAIESVMSQTLQEIEIIVVDDNNQGSNEREETEKLLTILKEKDSRIIYVKHEKNKNGAAARNSGIKVSRGKYLAFLDDDDIFLPEKLMEQYNQMETTNNPKFGGSYTGCYFNRNGKAVKTLVNIESGNYIVDVLACKFQMGSGSNIFVSNKIIKELRGFDERFKRHQDYEFLVRFFEKYDLLAINKPLFIVEQYAGFQNTPNVDLLSKTKKLYLDKYKYILNTLTKENVNYIMHSNFISLCEAAIKGKEYKNARVYYKTANSYLKCSLKQILRLSLLTLYSILPIHLRKSMKWGRN